MNDKPNTEHRSFRFRMGTGKWLTDEIAHIERLATERLRAGVSYNSVQTGAFVLLKMALDGVSTELVMESALIQACTPATETPRGPLSLESVALLRDLQQQAAKARKGKVVRLCGNHELCLLQGKYHLVDFEDCEVFAEELKKEIRAGRVAAAYTNGQRLFTHAGLRSPLREKLMSEIAPDTSQGRDSDVRIGMDFAERDCLGQAQSDSQLGFGSSVAGA